MNIHAIRLRNLKRLIAECGTVENVADLSDVSDGYLKEILRGDTLPSGNPKGIGHKVARKIEVGCSKPDGWMDQQHGEPSPAHPEELRLSPQEQQLIVLFRRAPHDVRRLIMYAAELAKPKKGDSK